MWELRRPAAVAAGKRRTRLSSEMSSSARAVEVAVVMEVIAVVVVAAAVVTAFDLVWEILARFAPGSVTPFGSWVSHRLGTLVPDILAMD